MSDVTISRALLQSLIAMANHHLEDIDTGLEDGTYEANDNQDIDQKHEDVRKAETLLAGIQASAGQQVTETCDCCHGKGVLPEVGGGESGCFNCCGSGNLKYEVTH